HPIISPQSGWKPCLLVEPLSRGASRVPSSCPWAWGLADPPGSASQASLSPKDPLPTMYQNHSPSVTECWPGTLSREGRQVTQAPCPHHRLLPPAALLGPSRVPVRWAGRGLSLCCQHRPLVAMCPSHQATGCGYICCFFFSLKVAYLIFKNSEGAKEKKGRK
ncbi:hypothetical protein H1C71_011777, partial [Ictidomys tridecemlineatus]